MYTRARTDAVLHYTTRNTKYVKDFFEAELGLSILSIGCIRTKKIIGLRAFSLGMVKKSATSVDYVVG